jgi:hypothetical protein
MSGGLSAPGQHRYEGHDDALDDYFARGWTDGLPIVPPTVQLVARFLEATGSAADDVVGAVPTRDVVVTAQHVAINAVMAGCEVSFMPVVLAAVGAQLDELAQCHATIGTLWGASQVVIVNGPIRAQLGIASGIGCMGPGYRANATIGRALRLTMRNACIAQPGGLDRAVFSSPERFSFCFGENEEATVWTPLHEERGAARGSSAVTVVSVVPSPTLVYTSPSRAEDLLDDYVQTFVADRYPWEVDLMGELADYPVVISPDHAEILARAGHTKATVRDHLWQALQSSAAATGRRCRIGRPEGLLLVVAGGRGGALTTVMTPHVGLAVTRTIHPLHPPEDTL